MASKHAAKRGSDETTLRRVGMSVRPRLPRLTDRIRLGTTGLQVSPVCLGMVGSPETVSAAFDAGINFFFITADMHWPYYQPLRRGLHQLLTKSRGMRNRVVIAVVSYPTQPEFCSMPFLEVLENTPSLQKIDVGVMGGVYASEFDTRLEVYREHRRIRHAGITAIGATFHDRLAARNALAFQSVDIAFARYNSSHPGAREDLFPHRAQSSATPLYNFKSTAGFVTAARMKALGIGRDYWRPHVTDHYRFVLTRPEVDGLLCSLSAPNQVAALQRALEKGPLSEEDENYLISLSAVAEGRAILEP